MHLGVAFFATDESADVREVARAAEALGFESLWLPEHTHIPVSRATPYPPGGDLPRDYLRCLDPFVALMAVAGVTERLRLGTGVCLVTERDPIVLAKETATLDLLSDGRLLFGVGTGWNVEEMADHGVEFGRRFGVMRDRVKAVRTLWTEDEAAYDSEFVTFAPAWQWPKPKQSPHPPILVGGSGQTAMKHAIEYGDGWLPMPDKRHGSMTDRMRTFAELAEAAGRPMPEVTAYAATPDPAIVEHYARLGISRCVYLLPYGGSAVDDVERVAKAVGLT